MAKMSPMQRYVSNELTHFIGKDRSQEEERYEILIEILTSERLMHPPRDPNKSHNLQINLEARISENEMFNPQMICFCDIPIDDLEIHMRKYSRFGISFLKDYLIGKGANPVNYVTKNGSVGSEFAGYTNRGKYFDEMVKKCTNLILSIENMFTPEDSTPFTAEPSPSYTDSVMDVVIPTGKVLRVSDNPTDVSHFLCFQIFGYMKCFEALLPDDEEQNYYMEREWRVLENINFNLEEVNRVILPKSYSKRFHDDMPQYRGQITFS